MLGKFQVARIQPFAGRENVDGERESNWVIFLRGRGQVADVPLIPSEQMVSGGALSVRGYDEDAFSGDNGFEFIAEIRTPMIMGLFTRTLGFYPEVDSTPPDRTQFVVFADAAYLETLEPLDTGNDTQDLASVGIGMRLALGENAQLRADWGYPLVDTLRNDSSGKAHIEFQVQF
jgi:hemolysin activation/secretion protein